MTDLIPFLSQQGFSVHPFAYDFRYSVTILAGSLEEKINKVMAKTGASTVDIVAHSMGTLVTRQYLLDHPADSHVGTVVLIASPNLGAPKTLKVLRYGDNLDHSWLLDKCSVKRAGHNLPSLYEFLPSQRYFQVAAGYFATTIYYANDAALNCDHGSMPDNSEIEKQVAGLLQNGPGIYGKQITTTPPTRGFRQSTEVIAIPTDDHAAGPTARKRPLP
jgi:triacylglycerol esterase/lipase EstA (alpha/beta hydrolase family)